MATFNVPPWTIVPLLPLIQSWRYVETVVECQRVVRKNVTRNIIGLQAAVNSSKYYCGPHKYIPLWRKNDGRSSIFPVRISYTRTHTFIFIGLLSLLDLLFADMFSSR